MSRVDVAHVSKRYGAVTALDDVSLSFADGEFFGLLGPSGSGKTTLLRAVAGFVDPDEGDIGIDDRPVSDIPVHRRQIGMVFQNYALFPHMSVFDNVAFGLTVRHLSSPDVKAQVTAMLDLVRLNGFEERWPRQLSGGQQQRVAIARALVGRPRVILADEPTGNLDPKTSEVIWDLFLRLQAERGLAFVVATHNHELARKADRGYRLVDGRAVSWP